MMKKKSSSKRRRRRRSRREKRKNATKMLLLPMQTRSLLFSLDEMLFCCSSAGRGRRGLTYTTFIHC
jgi:hypothetical protein